MIIRILDLTALRVCPLTQVYSVAITPDGRYAISGSHDKTLRVWDITTGSCVRVMTGHTDAVRDDLMMRWMQAGSGVCSVIVGT